jgi:hypothetical protein
MTARPPRVVWRFRTPLVDRPCRVLFAGPHFPAALGLTQSVLQRRPHLEHHRIELVPAPTDQDLWHLAPTADVALPFMQTFDAAWIQRAATGVSQDGSTSDRPRL